MNREKFILELKNRLSKLPKDELEAAIGYYEEYFDEAGPENELRVIQELGSPAVIAKQMMADFAIKNASDEAPSPKNGVWTIWVVLLAILASPIALPLAFACIMLVFAGIMVIGSLIFAGGVLVISLLGSGILVIGISFRILWIEPLTALFALGIALVLIGFGILAIILVYGLVGKLIPLIVKGISKLFNQTKRGKIS